MASTPSVCIVLDGANVATRKTGQRVIPRLAAALAFFRELGQSRGCALRCVAFVPNFWLNSKTVDASTGNGSMETDDYDLLQSLVDQDLVVLTPSHAHDDYYMIDYAMKNDGFVVTNDMFRDHVNQKRVFQGKRLTHKWTRTRCIDFTFVGNEFLPNSQTIELALVHQPQPNSPSDTIAATVCPTDTIAATVSPSDMIDTTVSPSDMIDTTVSPSDMIDTTMAPSDTIAATVSPSESGAPSTDAPAIKKAVTASKPRTPRRKSAPLRSSSLKQSIQTAQQDSDDEEDDADETNQGQNGHSTAVDQGRKNVDLSELTPYRVPRYLLPFLHGDDSQTMGRFMDHTNTYIVLPVLNSNATSDVATLTIYGSEPNRMHAVKILDAALPELQQQYEFQIQQQQHQQWLLAQQQQQQGQQHQFQSEHEYQLFLQQQQQQQQYLQQQQYHQQQHLHNQHHPPANYPLQHHHAYDGSDDRMDLEME